MKKLFLWGALMLSLCCFAQAQDALDPILAEQEICITTDTFKLPGTITYLKSDKKMPIVILVHGSGPSDRDETIGPNKPFRDIAWQLAPEGIAVIRFEKRTKQYGAKAFPKETDANFDTETVDDVLSAINLAKTFPQIDKKRIFVLGHSLGGELVPRIAQRAGDKALSGIISMAGPTRKMREMLIAQFTYLSELRGIKTNIMPNVEAVMKLMPEPYQQMEANYNPVEVASQLKLPMLFMQGERDYQVTMEDLNNWRKGLESHKNVTFKSYPKLNHLFMEGEGKSSPVEYGTPSHIPAYVIDDIVTFVTAKH